MLGFWRWNGKEEIGGFSKPLFYGILMRRCTLSAPWEHNSEEDRHLWQVLPLGRASVSATN